MTTYIFTAHFYNDLMIGIKYPSLLYSDRNKCPVNDTRMNYVILYIISIITHYTTLKVKLLIYYIYHISYYLINVLTLGHCSWL